MGIPDRIILTLYTFLMAVFALLMVGLTLSLLPDGPLVAMISSLPGDWRFTRGGVIVFLISMAIAIGVFQIWLQVQFPLGLFEMFRY